MRTTLAIALTGVVALAASGCGTQERQDNRLRPPAPIVMSATITPSRINVSPSRAGAGPVTVLVTNLTGNAQTVTFETATLPGSGKVGIRQQTGPINPQDTATIKAQALPGTYRVKVAGDTVAPAIVMIGHKRISSQNDLMLP
ncbi:MAG TPA: hypothetical protein VII98_10610 [Solirubrobacteraceae bacterium]